ncbi:MAG: RES family NAD+ phosphorylase [Thiotrichaceae bacterium]
MSRRNVHDRELLDFLDALEPEIYTGTVWRTTWKGRDPLLGSRGGGRWSPDNEFEVLYTSLKKNVSLAELYHHLSTAPVFSSRVVVISQLRVESARVLNINAEKLMSLGVTKTSAADYQRSQAIGAAANFLGYQGVLVPSVRRDGVNLVFFTERLDVNVLAIAKDAEEINWPAWIERSRL